MEGIIRCTEEAANFGELQFTAHIHTALRWSAMLLDSKIFTYTVGQIRTQELAYIHVFFFSFSPFLFGIHEDMSQTTHCPAIATPVCRSIPPHHQPTHRTWLQPYCLFQEGKIGNDIPELLAKGQVRP
jgi:hypothetical protein